MSSTETTVNNLKINRGTYSVLQSNLSSIGENELVLVTDKAVPIPTTLDSGKVVSVNSSGEYVLSTPSGGMTNPMTTAGDLIIGGSSGSPTRLAKGSNGQVLKMVSGSVAWSTDSGMTNPMTTAGDIIYGGSSGTPTRLAKGSAGQVLTMNSTATAPEWTTFSGGGGITELSTQYVRITDLDSGVYKLTYNGTKYLYYYGTTSTTTHTVTGGTGVVVLVVSKYSTTYWHWWYINGTTSFATLYYGYTYSSGGSSGSKSLNSIYTGTPTDTKPQYLYHYNTTFKNTSNSAINRYQILVFNGTGLSPYTSTSNSTGTSKTQLDAKYYPNSPIFYYGSTSSVGTNNNISGSYLYQSYYSIDLRYSFNIGTSTLTTYSPVYIKMSVNSDGTLSPVYSASSAGHPLTNTLPSSDDGYVYVYLGNSGSSSYIIDLEPMHPCLWYKDGKILPYGGGGSSSGGSYTAGTGIDITSNVISNTGVSYLTTAPSSANTSGDLKFVVLSSEPSTKYNGYIYIIT